MSCLSDTVGYFLKLPVEGQVGCVPVTTALELQDVLCLDNRDKGVVALEPVVSARVHPADVVTAVGRAALMRHDTH